MTLALCVENRGGLTLFGKRLSRDFALCEDLTREASSLNGLIITPFSKKMFDQMFQSAENSYSLVVEKPEPIATTNGFIFAEKAEDVYALLPRTDELLIYHWNRDYPFDTKLEFRPDEWDAAGERHIVGTSHPDIFVEKFIRKKTIG